MEIYLSIANLVATSLIAITQLFLFRKINDYESINMVKSENTKILFTKRITTYEAVISIIRKVEHIQAFISSYEIEIQSKYELPKFVKDKLTEVNKLANELDICVWDNIIYLPKIIKDCSLSYRSLAAYYIESIYIKGKHIKNDNQITMLNKYINDGNKLHEDIKSTIEDTFTYHDNEEDPEYTFDYMYISRALHDIAEDITEEINYFIAENTL